MSKNIVICCIFILLLLSPFCLSETYALEDIFSDGKEFLKAGNNIEDKINTDKLEETSDFIYNALFAIAVMVAIIVAMILGIQFMAASADEKAKVKEALMPFVIGCFVVFGSFTIWKVAVNIGNNAERSVQSFSELEDELLNYDTQTILGMNENELEKYSEELKDFIEKCDEKGEVQIAKDAEDLRDRIESLRVNGPEGFYKEWFETFGKNNSDEVAYQKAKDVDISPFPIETVEIYRKAFGDGASYFNEYIGDEVKGEQLFYKMQECEENIIYSGVYNKVNRDLTRVTNGILWDLYVNREDLEFHARKIILDNDLYNKKNYLISFDLERIVIDLLGDDRGEIYSEARKRGLIADDGYTFLY